MSDYPQTAVSHIVRTQHFYFAQRDTTPACFGPFVTILKLQLESAVDDFPVIGLGFSCYADVAERVAIAAVEVGQDPVDNDIAGTVIIFDAAVMVLWI